MLIRIGSYFGYNRKIKQRDISTRLFYVISFLALCYVFVHRDGRPDYEMYNMIYYGVYPDHEIGYMALNTFFSKLGFDFRQFLMVISFVGLMLVFKTLFNQCNMKIAILITYIWFPFLNDGIQIRSFLANALIIIAFKYLLSPRRKDIAKYVLFVLLAASMHYYAFIFVALLLAKMKFSKRQLAMISIFVSFVGIILFRTTDWIPNLMSAIFGAGSKVASNFYSEGALGFVIPIVLQVLHFAIFYRTYRIKNHFISYNEGLYGAMFSDEMFRYKNGIDAYKSEVLLRTNIIFMMILFPLYTFDIEFFRVYRALFIVNSIYIYNVMYKMKEKKSSFGLNNYDLCIIIYNIVVGVVMGHNLARISDWIR